MRKKTKFLVLRISIILLFVILSGRIWYVQVVMGSYYKTQADTSKIRFEPVQALRGILYDSRGVPLVFNAPAWDVRIVPHGVPVQGARQLYSRLSRLLGGQPTARQIEQKVNESQWRAYAPVLIKGRVSTQTAMIVKQLHLRLPGVRADPASVRQYNLDPQNSLSHILGYTLEIGTDTYATYSHDFPLEHYGASDQIGGAGIEAGMEPYLHGVNGTQQVMVDAGERPIRTLKQARLIPGDDVWLTIDSHLQRQVALDLSGALNKLGLRRGVAIVEDVHTGAILSMISLPSFDNNLFSGGISNRQYAALTKDPDKPMLDLSTQGQFPPGSTFKIITAAAALQSHVVDANTTIVDNGVIKLCSIYVSNRCQDYYGWEPPPGLGPENVVGALAQSSDIYFYTVAGGDPKDYPGIAYVGANRLAKYAREFGLGSPTGIGKELPGEAAGFVPSATWFDNLKPDGIQKNPGDAWHIGNTYNMAIGQGQDDTTPLQMVNVTATIANGGTLYRPRIVQQIVGRVQPNEGPSDRKHVIQPFVPSIIRKGFIDPYNLSLIQTGMHLSVSLPGIQGTSFAVRDPRIDAAGKTGTAEAYLPGLIPSPHAWWVGYAPYRNPKIAVVVMVPNADSEGAYVAAPIAHKIFEDYFHLKPTESDGLPTVKRFLVPGATYSG